MPVPRRIKIRTARVSWVLRCRTPSGGKELQDKPVTGTGSNHFHQGIDCSGAAIYAGEVVWPIILRLDVSLARQLLSSWSSAF
jgi:hypothetical protein